jgi:eukaryotic-like serine/threonine-protein kinase
MSVATSDRFLELVRRSELVNPQALKDFTAGLSKDDHAESPEVIAERLIEAKLLNSWQADNLLKGKYKGFTLGKYRLLGLLGTGGMSSVYLAEHPIMERLVAVKVLPKRFVENRNYLDRFRREARAAASLDHPNIVRAFDIDQDGDTHYIVMEYVEGRDLQRMVKDHGPLDPLDAAGFIAQAAQGLQHAHDAGLIHRDVKPANCLVDKKNVLKLLDLGLAKFSADTHPGLSEIYEDSVVGTADYLAPEQAINSQKIDSRADIYGLGCTLYFLLSGQPPFPTGSIAERLLKHQTAEPASLYQLRPETPPFLVDICRRMMIKSPKERIQRATDVANEIHGWLASRGRTSGMGGPSGGTRSSGPDVRSGRHSLPDSSRNLSRSSRVRPPIPPNDTLTSRGEPTRRLPSVSGGDDDLQLAPLEEENRSSTAPPSAKPPARQDSPASKDTVHSKTKKDVKDKTSQGIDAKASGSSTAAQNSSSRSSVSPGPGIRSSTTEIPAPGESPGSEEESSDPAGMASGPLDTLLKENQLARASQIRPVQLSTKRKEEGADPHWLLLIVILSLFGVALLILILATILF